MKFTPTWYKTDFTDIPSFQEMEDITGTAYDAQGMYVGPKQKPNMQLVLDQRTKRQYWAPQEYDDDAVKYGAAKLEKDFNSKEWWGMVHDPHLSVGQKISTAYIETLKQAGKFLAKAPTELVAGVTGITDAVGIDAGNLVKAAFVQANLPTYLASSVARKGIKATAQDYLQLFKDIKTPSGQMGSTASLYRASAKNWENTLDKYLPDVDDNIRAHSTLVTIGSMAGQIGGSLLLAAATNGVGGLTAVAGVFGSQQFYNIREEYLQKGYSLDSANIYAGLAAIAEGGLEAVGFEKWLKYATLKPSLRNHLIAGLMEASQEATQTTAEELITNLSGVREETLTEILAQIAISAVAGFVPGAGISVASGGLGARQEKAAYELNNAIKQSSIVPSFAQRNENISTREGDFIKGTDTKTELQLAKANKGSNPIYETVRNIANAYGITEEKAVDAFYAFARNEAVQGRIGEELLEGLGKQMIAYKNQLALPDKTADKENKQAAQDINFHLSQEAADAFRDNIRNAAKQAGRSQEEADLIAQSEGRIYEHLSNELGEDVQQIKAVEISAVPQAREQTQMTTEERLQEAAAIDGQIAQLEETKRQLAQTASAQESPLDLSKDFSRIAKLPKNERQASLEKVLNNLIGKAFPTATEPLRVQITQDNSPHIVGTNINLSAGQEKRHLAALKSLEQIIRHAVKSDKEGTVDLSHNTNPKTLAHKSNVLQYIYFESPIKIGTDTFVVELATEQIQGQSPDLLDLYHVRVKRKSQPAAQLSTLQVGSPTNRVTNEAENVNGQIDEKIEGLKQEKDNLLNRGYFQPGELLNKITLTGQSDITTVKHELMHHWRDIVRVMAARGNQKAMALNRAMDKIISENKEYVKQDQNKAEEVITEAYEAWLYSGVVASTQQEQTLFDTLKRYFQAVYDSIKDITGIRINPEIDLFFRQMTGLMPIRIADETAKTQENKKLTDLKNKFREQNPTVKEGDTGTLTGFFVREVVSESLRSPNAGEIREHDIVFVKRGKRWEFKEVTGIEPASSSLKGDGLRLGYENKTVSANKVFVPTEEFITKRQNGGKDWNWGKVKEIILQRLNISNTEFEDTRHWLEAENPLSTVGTATGPENGPKYNYKVVKTERAGLTQAQREHIAQEIINNVEGSLFSRFNVKRKDAQRPYSGQYNAYWVDDAGKSTTLPQKAQEQDKRYRSNPQEFIKINIPGSKAKLTVQKDPLAIRGLFKELGISITPKKEYAADKLFQPAYAGAKVDFDKFSLDAIGTGEGAQAHGWGLYFAKLRAVAEGYRAKLVADKNAYNPGYGRKIRVGNKTYTKVSTNTYHDEQSQNIDDALNIAFSVFELNRNKEVVMRVLERQIKSLTDIQYWDDARAHRQALEFVKNNDFQVVYEPLEMGQVFGVDIPENDVLLDEQKTFEQQPKKVQKALEKIANDFGVQIKGKVQAGINFHDITGKYVYNKLAGTVGGQKQASQTMLAYGIEGITYDGKYDGRCYVIFNDKAVRIQQTFYQTIKAQQTGSKAADDKPSKETIAKDLETLRNNGVEKYEPKSKLGESIGNFGKHILLTVRQRAGAIDPKIKAFFDKLDYFQPNLEKKFASKANGFIKKFQTLTEEEKNEFDYYVYNQCHEELDNFLKDKGISQEYQEVRQLLNFIYAISNQAGIDMGFISEYFPTSMIDYGGFLDYLKGTDKWSYIAKSLQEADPQGLWSDKEKAEAINKLLRGYSLDPVHGPKNAKERKILYKSPELMRFYEHSDVALIKYLQGMSQAIAINKAFGKGGGFDTDATIGAVVLDLISSGTITHQEETEIKRLLKSRLSYGATPEFIAMVKNVGYLQTMNNFTSAITQLGDLYAPFYKYSFGTALKSIFGKSEITKKDLGLDKIWEEFKESGNKGLARITGISVEKLFKAVGLDALDSFGKNVAINASWLNLKKQADKGDIDLVSRLAYTFGKDAQSVLKDIKAGNITDDVKILIWADLADTQPIGRSGVPTGYLDNPHGRLFYQLKTFTLNQISLFYADSLVNIQKGIKYKNKEQFLKGVGNGFKLLLLLTAGNATADILKNLVMGRDIDISDTVVSNLLWNIGVSKYSFYKGKREGYANTLFFSYLAIPQLNAFDDMWREQQKISAGKMKMRDTAAITYFPFGRAYYWWFGGGSKAGQKRTAKMKKTAAKKIRQSKRRNRQ